MNETGGSGYTSGSPGLPAADRAPLELAGSYTATWMDSTGVTTWSGKLGHRCDGFCVCPVHLTPLIHAPAARDHACQDVTCRYGHGMRDAT